MIETPESLLLRDYIVDLESRLSEMSGSEDFDRGYAMGMNAALEALLNRVETFGISLPDL